MQVTTNILAVMLLLAAQVSAQETPRSGDYATIEHAVVSPKYYVQLPAMQAGVLSKLELEDGTPVEEGVAVSKEQLLGKLDDRDAAARQRAARLEHRVSQSELTKSRVEIDRAKTQTKFYGTELSASEAINKRSPGAIPETELRRLRVQVELGEAGEKVADADAASAQVNTELREAQMELASINLEHHQITSPLDGEVVQVYRQVGEWVSTGDPIVRIVDLKRLRVEGFLKINDYLRQEVIGQPVTIEIRLPGRRVERFTSVIKHASPLVQASGDYRVVCEVENRKSEGQWVLLPGMDASMQITLRKSSLAVAR